jgi:murein DD-endopeptidase MepM/ murein hydrolase activator NlpD
MEKVARRPFPKGATKGAAAFCAAFLLLAAPRLLVPATRESLRAASGAMMDMAFEALEPGQPVLFVLKSPEVTAAIVHFRGQTAVVRADSSSGAEPMGFIGIDLDVRPGAYPVDIQFEKKDGTVESFRGTITVRDRKFPSQRLRVPQEFVTPPRSEQERIRRESEIVNLIFSQMTPEWLGDGPFIAPHPVAPWPNFGQRRVTNGVLSSVHAGIDLPVPLGEPIRAVNRGRVVLASPLYLSGETVIIDHGLGVFSFYCHLSKLLVRRDDIVAKGAVIGNCGTSGRSTGPHLHWSMRVGASRVDPYAFLALPVGSRDTARDKR